MILIITHKTDFTADFLINKLNQKSIKYKRFNCEDIFTDDFAFRFNPNFEYSFLGEDNYQSIWFRRTKFPEIVGLTDMERIYLLNETDCLFKNMFEVLSANWLSSPFAVYQAENKLLQLKVAKKVGFTIPNTLITNSKSELNNFYLNNSRNVVIKPISQTRIDYSGDSAFIFTNCLSEKIMERLEEFDLTPCIFQENIEKEYEIRVTVVGKKVFASAVYSQTDEETITDWRRKKLEFIEVGLPTKINDLCIQLLIELNLEFGAIDLIKKPNGNYVFLEINPNGQWVWIENQTGQKISDEIIKFLIKYN